MELREGTFPGFRQNSIYYRYFLPVGSPRAVLLLVHGLADHPVELAGLVLSAPVLKPGASITRGQTMLTWWLSVLFPKLGVAPIESASVSRCPEVVAAYRNDPLVYHGKISARLGAELLNVMEKELPGYLPQIALPLLVMYGSEDKLSNPLLLRDCRRRGQDPQMLRWPLSRDFQRAGAFAGVGRYRRLAGIAT